MFYTYISYQKKTPIKPIDKSINERKCASIRNGVKYIDMFTLTSIQNAKPTRCSSCN